LFLHGTRCAKLEKPASIAGFFMPDSFVSIQSVSVIKSGIGRQYMQSVTQKSYARIGLIGNPSDGYGGRTLSAICKNFFAEVTLVESKQLVIETDEYRFDSVAALQDQIEIDGYYGASRLFKATVSVFARYLARKQPSLSLDRCFTASYRTNIPRMVGLAGSSALVVAMLKALMEFYAVSIDQRILPSLALDVERRELNIGGGLQDRVVQIYEGLISMNFVEMQEIEGYQCGNYEVLDSALLPPIYLAYSSAGSEPTEVFHNDLRSRYDSGESDVVDAMQELAELTGQTLLAIKSGDHALVSKYMDRNFDIRHSISNLNPHHLQMIQTARDCGVSAKYAGSGGAIVGVCSDDEVFDQLKRRLGAIGCEVCRPVMS